MPVRASLDPPVDGGQERTDAAPPAASPPSPSCDACGVRIEGEPAGRAFYLWTRGDETRVETPPLCARCATAIGVSALAAWDLEEDEG